MAQRDQNRRVGDAVFSKVEKINSELDAQRERARAAEEEAERAIFEARAQLEVKEEEHQKRVLEFEAERLEQQRKQR